VGVPQSALRSMSTAPPPGAKAPPGNMA
jgi:hypothetical protein